MNADSWIMPSLIELQMSPDIIDDVNPDDIYLGFCQGGNPLESEAKWLIKRIIKTTGITRTYYAEGTRLFDKIWDDRINYNYTFKR